MKKSMKWLSAGVIGFGLCGHAAVPDIEDSFESYAEGSGFFDATVAGWRASSRAVLVTASGGYSGQAVVMGCQSALTNSVGGGAGASMLWTEVMIHPVVGDEPPAPATNSASFGCYFNSDGFLVAYAAAGSSLTCSNDVWGNPVPPATNGYARVTICQDFSRSREAVFLDGRLLAQDLPFITASSDYNALLVNNADNEARLDDVWIKASRHASVLTNDLNGDGLADSQEMADYHYVARTLYVGGAGYPAFMTIQDAVNAARPRDSIYVHAGAYGESVTVTGVVSFIGEAFSMNGCVVEPGASATFAQVVTMGTATIGGSMTFAAGAACSITAALSIGPAGLLSMAANSAFTASYAGVAMTGACAISNTWNMAASLPLAFHDDFERYADGTAVPQLAFQGWYADSSAVRVRALEGHGASKGVRLPACSVLSNHVNRVSSTKIWTDVWLTPALGAAPYNLPTNNASFAAYVNDEGRLVVYTNGGSRVCSNAWDGSVLAPLTSNAFIRITIFQDLAAARFAVFIGGKLVVEQASFPGGNDYRSFGVDNREGSTWVDDVTVTPDVPLGLAQPDALEIALYGSVGVQGTIYLMR